jgi:hypothetical protein
MHPFNLDYSSEREMESPFSTAAAQAGLSSFLPPNSNKALGSSLGSKQASQGSYSSSEKSSKQIGTPREDAAATSNPLPESGLLGLSSSLSDYSPFAHAPPLAPSLSTSLANSVRSSAVQSVQSDPRSQKSSPIGQSIASAMTETPEESVAAAMAEAAAATISPVHVPQNNGNSPNHHQRSLPSTLTSPFLNGNTPGIAANENIYNRNNNNPLTFHLYPVPEGVKEGDASTSTDISTPHFIEDMQQQKKQQLLQHLFPQSWSGAGGGSACGSANGIGSASPRSRTQSPSPAVYNHPSGIPRLNSNSSSSALSSPSSPAAAVAAAAATGGTFAFNGGKNSAPPPFTIGGVQLSQEQLQQAALQALQSGQSYASTLGGGGGSLQGGRGMGGGAAANAATAAAFQPRQQSSTADKLIAYQLIQQQQQMQHQQFPAVPAGVVQPPPPLSIQDAALQALQQPPSNLTNFNLYSPPRRSDSWGQFRGNMNRSSYPASAPTTPPDRRSLEVPCSLRNGGGTTDEVQLFFPAARYSLSRDSGGGMSRAGSVQPRAAGLTAEQRTASAALLLQKVQLSTKHYPKVSSLINRDIG